MLFKVHMTRFFQYVLDMYSKFRLVRILQNLFFRLQNTQIFLQKCPSYRGAKYDVEWFEKV